MIFSCWTPSWLQSLPSSFSLGDSSDKRPPTPTQRCTATTRKIHYTIVTHFFPFVTFQMIKKSHKYQWVTIWWSTKVCCVSGCGWIHCGDAALANFQVCAAPWTIYFYFISLSFLPWTNNNPTITASGVKGKIEQCNVPSSVLGAQILPKIVLCGQSGPKSALVLTPHVV